MFFYWLRSYVRSRYVCICLYSILSRRSRMFVLRLAGLSLCSLHARGYIEGQPHDTLYRHPHCELATLRFNCFVPTHSLSLMACTSQVGLAVVVVPYRIVSGRSASSLRNISTTAAKVQTAMQRKEGSHFQGLPL